MSQSRSITVSPSSLRITRSTPCVDGCCGPILSVISGASIRDSRVVAISTWCILMSDKLHFVVWCFKCSSVSDKLKFVGHFLRKITSGHLPRLDNETNIFHFAFFFLVAQLQH